MTSAELQKVLSARSRLESWIEAQNFAGYDTHDAMKSPLLGWIGRRNRFLGIGFVQLVRRAPLNIALKTVIGLYPTARIRTAPASNPKARAINEGTELRATLLSLPFSFGLPSGLAMPRLLRVACPIPLSLPPGQAHLLFSLRT